jgi:hypothetical protein
LDYLPRSVSFKSPIVLCALPAVLPAFAFGFELGIARHFACRFLHGAFGLLPCALNPIFIRISPYHCLELKQC